MEHESCIWKLDLPSVDTNTRTGSQGCSGVDLVVCLRHHCRTCESRVQRLKPSTSYMLCCCRHPNFRGTRDCGGRARRCD